MADKLKYKNISKADQTIVGVGFVKAGKTIEVDEPINNQNFELVEDEKEDKPKKKGE